MSNSLRRRHRTVGGFCQSDVATFMPVRGGIIDDTDDFTVSTDMEREGIYHISAGQHLTYQFDGLEVSNCPCHEQW